MLKKEIGGTKLRMVAVSKELYPRATLHADMEPDGWDVRRGTQTIVKRGNDS